MEINLDVVVAAYIKARGEIAELKSQIEAIEAKQRKKEDWLLGQLQKDGLQNAKTQHGTAYIALKESCTVADSEAFFNWVKDNDKYEFLERRVAKTPVLEYMGEDRGGVCPPGINYSAVRTVNIRKI